MIPEGEGVVQNLFKSKVPEGSSFILSGAPMVGKSVFVDNVFGTQLQRGMKGLYVALERPIEDFVNQLKTLGYENEISKIIFVDAYSWRTGGGSDTKHYLRNLSNLNELSVKLLMAVEELGKGGFYIIDSLTNLAPYNSEKDILHFFGVNAPRLKNNNSTGIWVVEEGIHAPSFYSMLNHLADGILEMNLEEADKSVNRRIRSRSLRGMPNSMNWCGVDISSNGTVSLRGNE